jgi:hypothetical protein
MDFFQQFPVIAAHNAMTTSFCSKAPSALHVADCLLRQLSFPAASTLLMRLLTQRARRRSTHTFASAVFKEMYHLLHSPPEAIFSAVVMVWTCILTISLFLLDSILPGGERPYSMCSWPPHQQRAANGDQTCA